MKYLKLFIGLLLVTIIGTTAYYTHRLWVFGTKVSKSLEYMYTGIECMIMENGRNGGDIDILNNGRKVKRKHVFYNEDIPACKKFYSEQRCWMLDPLNPKSVENCGPNFQLLPSEIEAINKAKTEQDKKDLMGKVWDRRFKEKENK